jgi:RNA polymerase sigma-70 factor (ECF subfamily)
LDFNDTEHLRWERQVVERAKDGDRAAFAELYRTFAKALYARVLFPRLGQKTAAEDALSETFRTGLERIAEFELRGSSIYFWFARIATNKAMDMHRARGVTGRALVNVRDLLLPTLQGPPGPEEALAERQGFELGQRRAKTCLERLNSRYREAIELRFYQGLGREECARRLDVKLGTFDVLLLRALRSFRKVWDAQEQELSA